METLPVNGTGNKHRDRLLEMAVRLVTYADARMGFRYAWQHSFHDEARSFLDAFALRTPTDAEAAITRLHLLLANCGDLVMKAQVLDVIDPEGSWRLPDG